MSYLLVLILGSSLTVLPGFRPHEQCEALGKVWIERMALRGGNPKPDYQCLPNK